MFYHSETTQLLNIKQNILSKVCYTQTGFLPRSTMKTYNQVDNIQRGLS